MIPISYPLIEEEEKTAALQVLSSGQLAQGPKVREFEERFAEFCGTKYAVATSSGTSALHVALCAHGIGPGDEVVTTSFSFIASANCALFVGARPVFADIEPDFFTIDPDQIKKRITSKTRAIIPVHLFGQACNMDAIAELAEANGLAIIEDACQAHGARYRGRSLGSWGTACYSFYPTKNMTTIEGGMITTNDPEIANRSRLIREHGSPKRYQHDVLGYNLRLTDLQAAIGLAQLPKLLDWNRRRADNAGYLSERLSGVDGITVPAIREGADHVFHQYTIRVRDRDTMQAKLTRKGIGTGVYYPLPIHMQPLYRQLGYRQTLEVTEAASQKVLSLPVRPGLTQAELDSVIEAIVTP